MENNVSISHSLDTHLSPGPATAIEEKSTEENVATASFVNHGMPLFHTRFSYYNSHEVSDGKNGLCLNKIITEITTYLYISYVVIALLELN